MQKPIRLYSKLITNSNDIREKEHAPEKGTYKFRNTYGHISVQILVRLNIKESESDWCHLMFF